MVELYDGDVSLRVIPDNRIYVGFHFVNPDLVGSTEPTEPAVLAYGLSDDDDLILGAVEYTVPRGTSTTQRN